jgi:hypothetical protein
MVVAVIPRWLLRLHWQIMESGYRAAGNREAMWLAQRRLIQLEEI